jgi:mono/diheme cytochrome c family protein/uncharacterized membrane protein
VLAGVVVVVCLGGRPLVAPPAAHAQADPSKAPAATGTEAARELFRQHCVKCHGPDGTGSPGRGRRPEIPDFTDASWQARRRDAQLLVSILDGKGQEMPSFRRKINEDLAGDLVAQVRSFAATTDRPGPENQKGPPSRRGFEEEFRRLEGEMDELKRQFREFSKGSTDRERSKPSESSPRSAPSKPSAPAAAGTEAARELFRRHCVKCHGADGSGRAGRDRRPETPDFTDASWQAGRSEAQLLASILDGKGKEMPPWREKIDEDQARALVAYVRAFARTTEPSGQGKREDSTPPEPAEAKPPRGFFGKLIDWFGKSHPAAVHFPIALLTAAAVAELLRLATGQPAFEAVCRYCLWFGTLTAVVAGVLGWCAGGFHLTDASWVLMTHRWLRTSTVAWAGVVLVLSEVSRRPDRRRTRMGFRVALLVVAALVLATGFFGGAVVFGLDHYTWPQ